LKRTGQTDKTFLKGVVLMQPQPAILSHDTSTAAEPLILGDGRGPGLAIVRRSLLRQIRAQMDGAAISSSGEQLGLLLGLEPQGDDLLVEDFIPLESVYCFPRSPEMLLAGIVSVQPMLDEARQERSHTIVGSYRILRSGEGSVSQSGFEFPLANGEEHSSLFNVRCHFVFVCLSDSETSLRVYMRNGAHWEQIQEVTLQAEPPSADLTPEHPAAKLTVTEQPQAGEHASPMAANIHPGGRLWFDVTIVTLLLLSLAANTRLVRFVRHIQQEKVNLQRVIDHIRVSTAAVSELPPPAAAPVPPEATARNRQPANADLPRKQVSKPRRIGKLAIAKKPAMLKPSEAFQFKVNGNPEPEVVWSSEGPGSIDPFYGLYRAPSEFAGETTVKIIAKSWRGSQSVTFTLKGESK
jgi:hypothetical protein